MGNIIARINAFVWGVPALVMILGVGLYLSIRLGFVQIRLFPEALKAFARQLLPGRGETSSFRSLCTALAATMGTGNLVGVAGAICLGGPGSIFWMWVCGLLGMVTKYAEAVLAVRYRKKTPEGYAGGPMYMITLALPDRFRFLAFSYALFGVLASFGVGNVTQINAAVTAIREAVSSHHMPEETFRLLTATLFALVIGSALLGGAGGIRSVTERLVPFAAGIYLILCLGILCLKFRLIPDAFSRIFQGAFSPGAVTGGMIGSAFQALRIGCSRGVFTNEAGMGTAAIAHADAEGVHPVRQGLMGIMEVFLDTIVICTMTALVILVSGVPVSYGRDPGGRLTSCAFSAVYGQGAAVCLALVLTLFALAAVMGWSLYSARCAAFLLGRNAWRYVSMLQILTVFAGSFLETGAIWQLSEAVNGLMAIPNLITLAVLTPEVARLTKEYRKTGHLDAGGGNYANFHQR